MDLSFSRIKKPKFGGAKLSGAATKGLKLGIDLTKSEPGVFAVLHPGTRREKIVHAGVWQLPEGCFDGGDVIDEQLFAEALSDYLKQARIKPEFASASIPSTKAFVDQLIVQDSDDEDLLAIQVEDHLESALNCSADEICFDYQTLGPLGKGSDEVTLAVVAIRREVIDSIVAAFSLAGVKLTAIDIESFAHVDAAVKITETPDFKHICLVEADARRVRVMLARDQLVVFDQTMPAVGQQWLDAGGWALEQLVSGMQAMSGAQLKGDNIKVIATGSRACYNEWLEVIERVLNAEVKSVASYCPDDIEPEVWSELPAAYGLATGGVA